MKRDMESRIQSREELEFVIFCVESIAAKLNEDAEKVYELLAKKTNILNEYIVPEYEVLHTQSKEYIVNEILEVLREKGETV